MTTAKHRLSAEVLLRPHRCPAWARSACRQCGNIVPAGYVTCRFHGGATRRAHAAAFGRLLALSTAEQRKG